MKPSEIEIEETIKMVEGHLANPSIEKPYNAPIKQGMQAALRMLKRRETQYNVGKLFTSQARAIAYLAVDYINGEEKQSFFKDYPMPE